MSWAAIFLASMLGSLHCVGMCGGFVAVVAGAGPREDRRRFAPTLVYQATRGGTYVLLGALAGLLGAGLEQGGALLGLQRIAGPLMGLSLIVLAIASLWPRRAPVPDPLISLGARRGERVGLLARARLSLTRSLRERGLRASAAAGLLTALLPCGWLWAYLLFAAGTGSPPRGAFAMLVFWAGSLPALLGVGLLAGELGRRLGRHAPRISAALMLTLGLLSLAGKLGPMPTHEPTTSEVASEPATREPANTEPANTEPAPPRDAPCH
ncbi:sulfite exporter TauE/SafE family protein [Nannocystaceae bacterium ST9]